MGRIGDTGSYLGGSGNASSEESLSPAVAPLGGGHRKRKRRALPIIVCGGTEAERGARAIQLYIEFGGLERLEVARRRGDVGGLRADAGDYREVRDKIPRSRAFGPAQPD